jgi:hypothetical protein
MVMVGTPAYYKSEYLPAYEQKLKDFSYLFLSCLGGIFDDLPNLSIEVALDAIALMYNKTEWQAIQFYSIE